MRNLNKVILIGNLTRDPEMRATPSGQHIATFGLATNREWITREGEKKQSSEFHELVCWGRLAEIANQYLKKGKLIYVEGYLKTRSWDDATGIKKFRTEIVIEDLIMLNKREKDGSATEGVLESLPEDTTRNTPEDAPPEEASPSVSIEDPLAI